MVGSGRQVDILERAMAPPNRLRLCSRGGSERGRSKKEMSEIFQELKSRL